MWRPCTGIPNLIPPLTTYDKLTDGTHSLAEVLQMNIVLDSALQQRLDTQSN